MIYPYSGILPSKKKEMTVILTAWKNLQKYVTDKTRLRNQMLHDAMSVAGRTDTVRL
jgi:hypothetical protein